MYAVHDLSKNNFIIFGRNHEKTAIRLYEEKTGMQVEQCGLFVDVLHPYLAGSPDGLVGPDGLVEVKCFPSIGNKTFVEAIESKMKLGLTFNGNTVALQEGHNYYYQIQGQLNITGRSFCDLVAYAPKDFFIQRIVRDEDLWQSDMLPKLTQFYKFCILPELADPRVPRKLPIREPQYIIEAQNLAKQKKESRKKN